LVSIGVTWVAVVLDREKRRGSPKQFLGLPWLRREK
jgi:hypothetical protein